MPMIARDMRLAGLVAGLALVGIALGSCGQVELADSSSKPELSGVIGRSFCTNRDLLAIGVTVDRNYKNIASYFVLVPPPGFSGPEVVATKPIKKGVSIRVTKILTARSFLLSRLIYVIELSSAAGDFSGKEIRVHADISKYGSNFGLDPDIFSEQKNSDCRRL